MHEQFHILQETPCMGAKNSVSNGRHLVDFNKVLWYNKIQMSKTRKKHEIWDFYVLHFTLFPVYRIVCQKSAF